MNKIEAIIVDGVIYDVVKSNERAICTHCDFDSKDGCTLDNNCVMVWEDEYFKRREMNLKYVRQAKESLAIPLRNCDVGTVEEQSRRFEKYCDNFGRCSNGEPKCHDCPLWKRAVKEGGKCEFMWAQLPYEEVKYEQA